MARKDNSSLLIGIVIGLLIIILISLGYLSFFNRSSGSAQYKHNGNGMMGGSGMSGGMMIQSEEQFIFEMIPHHQEAVDTAQFIYERTDNEALRELTGQIVTAQTREIQMLEDWKNEWYSESKYATSYTPMMPQLSKLSTKDADRAFLEGMIMHHMMAIMMARRTLSLETHEEIRAFSEEVIRVQTEEISRMRSILNTY